MNSTVLIRHLEAHDLLEGWAATTVGQVAEDISYGFTAKASNSETGPRYLRITDLQNGTVDWDLVPSCRIPKEKIQKYVLRRGDLVFARTGATTGKSFLVRSCPEAVFASYLIRVRPSPSVLPEFLAFFFQTASYWNQISDNIAGSAQPNCNATKLASLNVPVPPLDEQQRIVAKLEELLSKVEACKQRLMKTPVILKRFRQSVLAAACSGRLTADWRERNAAVESGSNLLNRIKEQRLLGAQNAKDKKQIVAAFGGHGRPAQVEDDFDDIPEMWVRCLVGQVGSVCNGSTPSRKREDYWGGAIPWVSSGEVRNNIIRTTRETISELGYENSSVRMLPTGSVLLAMIGEGKTRGQSAVLEIEATINQNIAAVILEHGLVTSDFLWRWFQLQYESTRERGGGSGPQALNCERVRNCRLF